MELGLSRTAETIFLIKLRDSLKNCITRIYLIQRG
jgi:hypothetical protein